MTTKQKLEFFDLCDQIIAEDDILKAKDQLAVLIRLLVVVIHQDEKNTTQTENVAARGKVSDKRLVQLRKYARLRTAFLEHRTCFCCANEHRSGLVPAVDVHHTKGRRGERLLDVDSWIGVCRPCHERIHANGKWARMMGYLVSPLFALFLFSSCAKTQLVNGEKSTTTERVVLGGGLFCPFTMEYDRTFEKAWTPSPRK